MSRLSRRPLLGGPVVPRLRAVLPLVDVVAAALLAVSGALVALDAAGVVDLPDAVRTAADVGLVAAVAALLVHGFLTLVGATADDRAAAVTMRRRVARALDVAAALVGAAFVAALLARLAERAGLPVSAPDLTDAERALGFAALTWAGVRTATAGAAPVAPAAPDVAAPAPAEPLPPRERLRASLVVLAIAATTAAGVLGLALLFDAARDGQAPDGRLFWAGLLVIALPPFARLLGAAPSRDERLVLLLQLGLALYAVKLLHDPLVGYADEWVHRANADGAAATGELFRANPVLEVTASYPGLAAVVASLASVTGLAPTTAGLVVIGVAKVLLVVSLFLVLERAVGSPRTASLATALYVGAPNFVFWSSQLAYESLALPVALAVLVLVARILDAEDASSRHRLAAFAAAGTAVVVVTHHLSSFSLALLLLALALATRGEERARGLRVLVVLGVGAVVAAAAWTSLVAAQAVDYLGYIFTSAVESAADVVTRQGEERGLFEGEGAAGLAERAVAIGGVALLLGLALLGLRPAWRRRRDAFVLLLVIAGLDYFASLALRFAPGAWETSNRASSLLFLGAVMLAGLGAREVLRRWGRPGAVLLVPAFGAIVASGVIAGWPPDLRLPRTQAVAADGAALRVPSFLVAGWAREALPPAAGVLADDSNGRVLLTVGGQRVYSGRRAYAREIYEEPVLAPWMLERMRRLGLGYVAVDRRTASTDTMRGYYFPAPGRPDDERDPAAIAKFEVAGADRIADAGTVVLYDVNRLLPAEPAP